MSKLVTVDAGGETIRFFSSNLQVAILMASLCGYDCDMEPTGTGSVRITATHKKSSFSVTGSSNEDAASKLVTALVKKGLIDERANR